MLRITLEQWRMFRAVVEYGGFNQAAAGVHKSQSSIHNAVAKIEAALGVKLFTVHGRKTTLTEAGNMMLRRAQYLLDEAAKVEAMGHTLGEGIESQLRIAVDELLPKELLFSVLEATSSQFPLLRIELFESVLAGANELLQDNKVDIAISPLANDDFCEELGHFEFIAVAHPQHALQQIPRALTFEDLKAHRQIVVRDSALNAQQSSGWLGAEQRWTVSHLHTSINMISKGLGFAWLPSIAITEQLEQGTLKALNIAGADTRTALLYLLFKDGDNLGPAARTFIGELRYRLMADE
ncbi:LysR family transcriptional regulator [Pseudoalteromonas sp. SW0106-04]|uniref:LysR family transcriptional regulator n=1 Tax=Pseudoalteromonas sp. SW0106-04 TaxID=1702169 RepID=UPI0006B40E6A|nr:LysR family transcriptional regulator [Pseudoalteromonas sp. SW0106-04]